MMNQILYLVPTSLSDNTTSWLLPEDRELVGNLDYFVVENAKTVRKHLKQLGIQKPLRDIQILVLDKNTQLDRQVFYDFLQTGQRVGLMSEAGCPAVADPGAWLVRLAHQMKFQVVPMVGPSSILLALMASGANGQNFAFRGYLPIEKNARIASINDMIDKINKHGETQIFIETPYRNHSLFDFLVTHLPDNMMMTLAINLTDWQKERVYSKSIRDWNQSKNFLDISKQPCVFVLG